MRTEYPNTRLAYEGLVRNKMNPDEWALHRTLTSWVWKRCTSKPKLVKDLGQKKYRAAKKRLNRAGYDY